MMKLCRKKGRLPLTLALILAMTAGMAGCGNSEAPAEGKTEETAEETTEKEETVSEEQTESDVLSIEEQVLLEWEGLTVTATGIDENSHSALKLLVENDTSYGIDLEVAEMYVNGCCMFTSDPGNSIGEVPAGKKLNASINFNQGVNGFLEKAGIEEVGSIELKFIVRDSSQDVYDDASALYTSEVITVKTSAYEDMDTEVIAEGKELYNQNGIRIVAKELSAYARSDYNYALFLYIENSTDKEVVVDCYDVSVDGFVKGDAAGTLCWIPAGRYTVTGLCVLCDEEVPNEDALKDVKEMEFGLKIYDSATWAWGYDDIGLLADTGMLVYEP